MTRLIGILIIAFGAVFALLGAIVLAAVIQAFATGVPLSSDGRGGAIFLSIGIAAIGYGWQCVKGFDKPRSGKQERPVKPIPPENNRRRGRGERL
ncbi:MAG: hypothetical protein ACLPIX_03230 [Rhodomicrobium sp.]